MASTNTSGSMSVFRYGRSYIGPVRACVLDWSGTVVDKYTLAPAVVFAQIFAKYGVPISTAEAREPMGLRKDLHIAAIARMPDVARRWRDKHGREVTQADMDKMYTDFIPLQLQCLEQYGGVLPGVAEAIKTLRQDMGVKVGLTTGFVRPMADVLVKCAKKQGLELDCNIAGDEVAHGTRPSPHMLYKNLDVMGVTNIHSVVKCGDGALDVEEGLNAGCWSVGVARWSNYMDVDSVEHEAALSRDDIARRLAKSRKQLEQAGAHYVIDSVADLPGVVREINARLARGEKP